MNKLKLVCTECGFPHEELEPLRDHLVTAHDIEWDHMDFIEKSTPPDTPIQILV